jgi:hypothetical protein
MNSNRPKQATSWIPSLSDVVFASVMGWLFLAGAGAVALLADGDTGWHIRTGEYILSNKTFPTQDLFSFSRSGDTWFAWEWLSDVAFALAHQAGGLTGVVLLGGTAIAATSALLFRYMLWQNVNVLVGILIMLVASSASTMHWLARPHIFTYLLFAVSLWALEADRRRPTPWIFGLAALSALWTNLHGGFAALVATTGIYFVGSAVETWWSSPQGRDWNRVRRYGLLTASVAAATLVSPYGYRLHLHIAQYLRSDFILNHVMEFQPPSFRGEGMRHFELLLFAGLACVPALLRRRDVTTTLLLLAWAHAALTSARHVLLYVLVAAPVVARELTVLLDRAAAGGPGVLRTLQQVAADYGVGRMGSTRGPVFGWLAPAAVAVVAVVLFTGGARYEKLRAEFSERTFPVKAVASASNLAGRRIFTSDQWADYLIYKYYPDVRVFIDGRSDFYGPDLGEQYLRAMNSHHEWERIFDRHRFDLALLPVKWPLATTIKSHPDWKVRYDDGKALLVERVAGPGAENARVRGGEAAPKS